MVKWVRLPRPAPAPPEQIRHQTGRQPGRSAWVLLLDGNDDFRILHPGQMLDGAGDADGDV